MNLERPEKYVFQSPLTGGERTAALIYLPLHAVILPLLLPIVNFYVPQPLDAVGINLLYYAFGVAFTAIFMHKCLRESFDRLLDNIARCLVTFIMAFFLYYVLSYVAALILLLTEESLSNPNNEAVSELVDSSYGALRGMIIFIIPIVEETLFRGAVFGSLREKNRILAYIVSVALFSLYHVWQYAVAYTDPTLLLYALQYIPVSVVLAWMYDRTGSLWTPIFFHMAINLTSLWVMGL